jgi:fructose-specific component phosphotransferase system IIB-like protein
MSLNLDPKTLWPDKRTVLRRLGRITLVLLPLSLLVFALLVGDWKLNIPEWTEETRRHLWEWAIILVVVIAVTFLASSLPLVQRFSGWMFSGRILRRMLIGLAWLVTMIVLFYAEEDWRGRHAWNQCRQLLEAGGAHLDYQAFIPKPIPANQNFAAIPLIESWFTQRTNFAKKWADNYALASSMIGSQSNPPAPEGNSFQAGERYFLNLAAWKMAFDSIQSGRTNAIGQFSSGTLDLTSRASAAPAVLAGLISSETELAPLRAASDRPYARYPVVYDLDNPWGILLPHLGNVKRNVQRLQLRACAELAAGKIDDAFADVKLMLYLADSVKNEPFLISYLVRIVCVQLAIQPVWDGLAEHAWSDAQLRELQTSFQQYDFVADMKEPLDSERAAAILTADLLARGKYNFNILTADPSQSGSGAADVFGRMVPRGWYDLEKLHYCQLFQLQLTGAFDTEKRQVFPRRIEADTNALAQAFAGRYPFSTICVRHQLLAVILLPALHKIPMRAAAAQTAVDEAAIACALERYRLANGQFPENLDALIPKFISSLPHDVISGGPYKYRRTHDGQFILYSVGWNEKDDGGVPGQTLFDDKEGDWVWQCPAK